MHSICPRRVLAEYGCSVRCMNSRLSTVCLCTVSRNFWRFETILASRLSTNVWAVWQLQIKWNCLPLLLSPHPHPFSAVDRTMPSLSLTEVTEAWMTGISTCYARGSVLKDLCDVISVWVSSLQTCGTKHQAAFGWASLASWQGCQNAHVPF